MGNRHLTQAQIDQIHREVVDYYRAVEEVGAEMGIAGSTVARHAAIERAARRARARALAEVPPTVVVEKDRKLIDFQGTTIQELRETVAELREKNRVLQQGFDLIRATLIDTEDKLGE